VSKAKDKVIEQPKLVADATVAVEKAVSASKVQFDGFLKNSTEAAEKLIATSKERIETVVKSYDEASTLGKETVEAMVNASTMTAKAMETVNAEVLAFAKSQIEESIAVSKSLMGAKTLHEVIELQNEYAKSAYEGYVSQSTKLSELVTKVSKEALEPITLKFKAAVEKMTKVPLAA
jgi:phasin family protein